MAWGKAAGIPHVFSSTWSQLERGIMSNPGPKVFLALAHQNSRIASADFGDGIGRALMDRLKAAEPVAHDDGEPWDAADFFAAYIGLELWPHPAVEPPQISAEDAATWSKDLRTAFRATADELKLSPMEAMVELLERGPEDRRSREQLQRVLLGFEDYEPADLLAEWAETQTDEAPHAIEQWRQSRGLGLAGLAAPWARQPPA